ncbi:MAG: hypothetical protein JWO36_7107 [Myxococcales bacterium]|nr:hypothetical protein [Myxococcales bacterium]
MRVLKFDDDDETVPITDPAVVLVRRLKQAGRPTQAWQADPDPIDAAWQASASPRAMIQLLSFGSRLNLFDVDSMSERGGIGWLFRYRDPDGRYHRIELSYQAGAAGLRALIERLPPLGEWIRAGQVQRAAIVDPVAALVSDLRAMGVASAEWVEQWKSIRAAWDASGSGSAMRDLLSVVGRNDLFAVAHAACVRMPAPNPVSHHRTMLPVEHDGIMAELERGMANAIRQAMPNPF